MLLIPSLCFAQKNYCKKIKRKVDEDKGTITYQSPILRDITVIKQFKTNPFFGLLLHIYDVYDHTEIIKGSEIEFEDGSVLKEENTKVDCKQEMTEISVNSFGASSHSGEYLLQGFFHINDKNAQKFANKKIVRVQLGPVSQRVPDKDATDMRHYVRCLRDFNP